MKLIDKPFFCVLPWIHLYTNPEGKMLPCCVADNSAPFPMMSEGEFPVLFNSKPMRELRQNMLNDIPSKTCNYCYKLEKYGTHSHRKHSNGKYLSHDNVLKIIENTNDDGTIDDINILYWDVRFSNVCNYKCRMCGSRYSTKWYEDADLLGWKTNPKDPTVSIANIKEFCDTNASYLKSIQYIYFAGGEPLVQPEHYEFLDWCIENNVDAELYYQSNGSILKYSKYNIFDLWSKFKRVTYSVSLDGLGAMGEYIRSGYNDAKVDNNLTKICEAFGSNEEITVNATFMAYNAFFATEFFDQMESKPWVMMSNVYTQLLIGPEHLQPKVLPVELKKQAIEKILNSKWYEKYPNKFESLLSNLKEESTPELWSKFKQYTSALDERRTENILNYFSELGPYYND